MRVEYKKIIAREFLYTLSGLIIIGIFIIAGNLYQKSTDNIRSEIANMESKDTINYRFNIYYVTKKIKDDNTNLEYIDEITSFIELDNRKEFIKKLKDEKIYSKFFDIASRTFNVEITKKQFIDRIKKDKNFSEEKLKKLELLESKLNDRKNSILNNDEFIIGVTLIVFLLFFILRYLIYATLWSVKQLKS